MKNNAKTILFASLIAAMVLPFSMIENSYAEFSPEVKAKAFEGAEIWKQLEKEQEKTTVDEDKVEQLTKDFKKIRYELNKEGIASAQQYEDNPDYWRSLSHPAYPDEVSDEIHLTSYSETIPTSSTCSTCAQKGYFVSGFDWWVIPSIWKTSESAETWAVVTQASPSVPYISQVLTDQHYAEIKPWSHYQLKKSGSIDWYSTHTVKNNYNVEIQHSPSFDFTTTYVRPSYSTLEYSWIDDVPRNSIHRTTAGAYSLN